MNYQIGKVYYRKESPKTKKIVFKASVIRISKITDTIVEFDVLHGCSQFMRERRQKTLKKFLKEKWQSCRDRGDKSEAYDYLDGCIIDKNYVMLDTKGNELFLCSQRRLNFYLRKGHIKHINGDRYQFLEDTTENKIMKLYGENRSAFFMQPKNNRCVCCGKDHGLTRHHVIPQRYKGKIPKESRIALSNVLFVCWECHEKYEKLLGNWEPEIDGDWRRYIVAWKDHFVQTMNPQFIPLGWDIFAKGII